MRTLVVGTTPPPGGIAARELAAVVAERTLAGDSVEVLSPDSRSAAHYTGNLAALLLPLRLGMMAPRFDALVLRIEPGLPFGTQAGRFVRGATLFGLGAVFGMFSEVTLRLDSPIALPGGVGGRATNNLWRRSTVIIVHNEADRERMLDAPGVTPDRVVVHEPLLVEVAHNEHPWPESAEHNLREQVLGQIRRRAQAERQANSARVDLGMEGVGPLVSEAFSARSRVHPSALAVAQATAARVVRAVAVRLPRSS